MNGLSDHCLLFSIELLLVLMDISRFISSDYPDVFEDYFKVIITFNILVSGHYVVKRLQPKHLLKIV